MTKFKFRLEPVLQHREKKEQQATLAQARAYREYLTHLELLQKARNELEGSLRADIGNDYFDTVNALMYREFLKAKVTEREQSVDKASRNLEKCRQKTIEARKQKLMLEKLKQNQLARYMRYLNKMEQKEIDELATKMSLRNQSNTIAAAEGGDLE